MIKLPHQLSLKLLLHLSHPNKISCFPSIFSFRCFFCYFPTEGPIFQNGLFGGKDGEVLRVLCSCSFLLGIMFILLALWLFRKLVIALSLSPVYRRTPVSAITIAHLDNIRKWLPSSTFHGNRANQNRAGNWDRPFHCSHTKSTIYCTY